MLYKVTLKSSGKTFQIKPSQTILEAATIAGITIPFGCGDGMCGACKGELINGNVMLDDYQESALTEEEKLDGLILCCKALATEDIEINIRGDENGGDAVGKVREISVRVESVEKLNEDIIKMILKLQDSEILKFRAGQYLEFIMDDGSRRAFSLANPPHENLLELHLKLIKEGKFTQFVFEKMQEKSIHRIEIPIGEFYLRESDKPIIFVAGGTGFAPIKSIIEDMIFKKIKRPTYLYRGVNKFEDLYMNSLPFEWAKQNNDFNYIPVSENKSEYSKQLRIGLVHEAVLEDFSTLKNVQVYCCGTPGLVKIAFESFIKKGLAEDAFFADGFPFDIPKK